MKLYEITNEFQNVFNQFNEEGELSEDMHEKLDLFQADFESKALSIAAHIKNLEAEEAAIANAMKDMAARRQKLTSQVDSLSSYLQFNLQQMSISEIKSSSYFKIKLRQCPPSVDVFNETLLPPQYFKEKIVKSVDKILLKQVLADGIEVPGAVIQRKIKLEIK